MLSSAPLRITIVLLVGIALFAPPAASQGFGTSRPGSNRTSQPATSGLFVVGKVMLDDGTAAPDSVAIERVCHGAVRREAYTDSKGRFSFDIGQQASGVQDSTASSPRDNAAGPLGTGGLILTSNAGLNSVGGVIGRLADCDLRAALAGYRSDVLSLSKLRISNNPELGAIILHRLANVAGSVISAVSLAAPPAARKAYEKGRAALIKNKPRVAEKEFEKAVALYPKHAAAWYELARLREQQNQMQQARGSCERALAADPKFVSPYLELAQMAARDRNWPAVASTTDQMIALDPVDFPQAYYYNALANFYLGKLNSAGKSAREARKLDAAHRFPKIDHVLGMILAEQHNNSGAAEALHSYLNFAPPERDAATARTQLAELENPGKPALGLTVNLAPAAKGVQAGIHIDAEHITLTQRDGNWNGQLELNIVFNDAGRPLSARTLPIQLLFTPEVLERVKKAGLTLHQNVDVPEGVSAMRVAVRDVPSGAMDALTLELPPR